MTALTQKEAGPTRLKARDAFCRGDVASAIVTQQSLIDATRDDAHPGDYLFLGSMLSAAGKFRAMRDLMLQGHALWPDEPHFIGSIGLCEARLRHWPEAVQWLDRAISLNPGDANLHDCMARVCGELGDLDGARRHGETSLTLKDASTADVAPAVDLAETPVPPFRPDTPDRNVIAFSLFGDKDRYCRAALENARIAPQIYPGWRCRFYVDSTVPPQVLAGLQAAGVQMVFKRGQERLYEGLFWRFHIANDPHVDRYLARDCDALLNAREERAVQAWIERGRHFHVMRDFFSHSELILAGLWGGVRGALPPLRPLYRPYLEDAAKTDHCDQRFLREAVWPTVRHSACIHDSLFRILGAQRFPSSARLPAGRHVGQDMAAWK